MPRKPKPTKLLELEKGKLYDDQRARAELEPVAEHDGVPICPKRFNKEEIKAWNELTHILKNYGLLTSANSFLMEMFSKKWVQYVSICNEIDSINMGRNITRNDFKVERLEKKQKRHEEIILKYLSELSLSSAGLAKIGSFILNSKKRKSEMEELID